MNEDGKVEKLFRTPRSFQLHFPTTGIDPFSIQSFIYTQAVVKIERLDSFIWKQLPNLTILPTTLSNYTHAGLTLCVYLTVIGDISYRNQIAGDPRELTNSL